jgi:dihydropteroate synthase
MSCMWKVARFNLSHSHGRPLIMGVVNVTPDSFLDGRRVLQFKQAIEHARCIVNFSGQLFLGCNFHANNPNIFPMCQ